MSSNNITKDNLETVVKDIIRTAPESITNVIADILEIEGSDSVIQYLYCLEEVSQNGGICLDLSENIHEIIKDCFAIADFCERIEYKQLN